MAEVFLALEQRVQRDEGGRGIRGILPEAAQLESGARAVLTAQRVAILTGFPCLLDCDPNFETDGPPGALAIAYTLETLGKDVIILTDESSYPAFRALVSWFNSEHRAHIGIRGFAPDSTDFRNLFTDFVISIERPGKAKDGNYYTMRGLSMTHLVAPLDEHFFAEGRPWGSFAIGDGGNEAGLGRLYPQISEHIPNGSLIGSTTVAGNVLVSSVSNWGGYALAIGISVAAGVKPVVSVEREEAVARKMAELGIRDGITKEIGLTADGLSWEVNAQLLTELLAIAVGQ